MRNPTRRTDLETRTVLDELVVLDAAGNRVHHLNSSASFIWDRCDGQQSVAEIGSELAAAHTLPVDQVVADVQRTITEFQQLGLLADDQA